jgi:exopolysaccharide transport family protein
MKENSPIRFQPLLPSQDFYFADRERREVHLRDYWKVIQKRRWTVLAIFLIVILTTAIATLAMKPIYRGSVTIQINKENPQIVDFKEMFTVNTADLDYYQTQYKILESRTLAKRITQELNISAHPEFRIDEPSTPFQVWKAKLLGSLSKWSDFMRSEEKNFSAEQKETAKETWLISEFLDHLKIEPIRNSRLVKIHFDAHDPRLSTQVPNTLAATYIKQNLETRFTATEEAKEWLTKQLDDLKGKVERSDEKLQAFGSKHDILSLEEKENIIIQRLMELNEALAKAESERMAKESLYKQTKDRNYEALPVILENKLIQELKQNNIQLEGQYMKLSENFMPEHPEMKRLKGQMETVQKRLNGEIGKIIAGIQNEYESASRKEALLRESFEQQKARAMEMKHKAIQYNILKREADTNKELYRGLLQRMKEAGVSAGITASNIRVVDQAEFPTKPHKPNKKLNLLLAAIVGLFLGVGLAFFFEYLDNTVKTPEDVEELIRIPSFGIVPAIYSRHRNRIGNGKSYPVELITHKNPRSALSEAYRNIRTSILLSFSERPPKILAISSPNPAEGKTTTVLNTAIALAQTGANVLLIDADMRKPRIHTIFNYENGAGLSSYLSGNAKLETIMHATGIPNLAYIPAGPIPPNPSELIGSPLFKNTIQTLKENFDHILIDTPPVLGFADSVILCSMVDGTMIVVGGGKTPKETLYQAREILMQVNARILGVVINRVEIHRGDYNSYYYRYRYYEEKKKKLPAPPKEEVH